LHIFASCLGHTSQKSFKSSTRLGQLPTRLTKVLIVLRLPWSSQSVCLETHSHAGLQVRRFHITVVATFVLILPFINF